MVKGNGFLSLTGLMLAAGLLVLYLGLCLTGSQRSRSHQPSMAWRGKWPWICSRSGSVVSATTRAAAAGNWSWKGTAMSSRKLRPDQGTALSAGPASDERRCVL